MKSNHIEVSIVGAGPGDPELISVKGLKRIQQAEVILYDALVNTELLKQANTNCELIYVGKRNNDHSYSQEEINNQIVHHALLNKFVVRLKGGDPFVFGRGKEEAEHLETFNITYEIVPGISSSTGGPTQAGLPLTKRGVNESFWVITATTQSGTLSEDLKLASKSNATLVLLMGTRKIQEIKKVLTTAGKSNTPVAFLENASMVNERLIYTRVSNMDETAKLQKLKSPALIIVGEVVASQSEFEPYLNELKNQNHEQSIISRIS